MTAWPPPLSRYYKITVVLMCFVVPTLVPWYIWGESLWNSYFLASILRYTISLNVTWLVNSVAHMYGNRPYDKHISPRQNPLVTLGAIGECRVGAPGDSGCVDLLGFSGVLQDMSREAREWRGLEWTWALVLESWLLDKPLTL